MAGANDILIASMKEKGTEVTNFLEKEGINIRYTSLRLIDYLIAGRIAVIRRTVDAFMEDLSNKMVYRTAPEFKRTFPDPLYIVEGSQPAATISSSTHGRSGVTYLTFVNRIPIIFASTPEETAKYLALMMKQVAFASAAEPTDMEELGDPEVLASDLSDQMPVQVLASIPGITSENAQALVSKFGSMRSIVEASEVELGKVRGIGAKKARLLSEVFGLQPTNGKSSKNSSQGKTTIKT